MSALIITALVCFGVQLIASGVVMCIAVSEFHTGKRKRDKELVWKESGHYNYDVNDYNRAVKQMESRSKWTKIAGTGIATSPLAIICVPLIAVYTVGVLLKKLVKNVFSQVIPAVTYKGE